MREATSPDRLTARPHGPLRGSARAPGDKSISHRALILASLATGRSDIAGLLEGADVMRTVEAMRAFGAGVERGPSGWTVAGRGGFEEPDSVIDCGNAGTAARLILGAASGFPLRATFTGDDSLRGRPMARVLEPLERMGARALARTGARLPLTIAGGGLQGILHRSAVASAQVKSAILLAGLQAAGETTVIEPSPSRDHTERMLAAFGVNVEVETVAHANRVRVHGGARLTPAQVVVPGDPSSAAFPLVAALVTPGSSVRIDEVLLNPLRTGLFETLREMGADLTETDVRDRAGERVGSLHARAGGLRGVVAPPGRAASMIDEYPILAVAAAFAEGETVMRGIGELRVKESDRIALTVEALRACGVDVEEEPDGLIVHGQSQPRGDARIRTHGDHRIGMCGLVLGGACRHAVEIDEPAMIATSFPGFAQLMNGLGASID